MAGTDDIGSRGEAIFAVRITDACGRKDPLFRPRFLGEKARTLDYFVELVGAGNSTPFFFAQVKATRQGYTRSSSDRRLKVKVSREDVRRLALYPAPAYVIGVDDLSEQAYIQGILSDMTDAIPSLPTAFPLDCANLPLLWDEVKRFWDGRDMAMRTSVFCP